MVMRRRKNWRGISFLVNESIVELLLDNGVGSKK
jgi:hypothetical protein